MPEIPTPLGGVPIAPASVSGPDVILWLVGILVVCLAVAVYKLSKIIDANAEACRKENEVAKAAAAAAQDKTEKLYKAAIAEVGERESRLVEVVTRNTAALDAIREAIGSGVYDARGQPRQRPGGG